MPVGGGNNKNNNNKVEYVNPHDEKPIGGGKN